MTKNNNGKTKVLWKGALALFLLCSSPMQQAQAQITVSTKRTQLVNVINQIKTKTKYRFFYNDTLGKTQVNAVKVTNASIKTVLDKLFHGTNITYHISGNVVYLNHAPKKPTQKTEGKKHADTKPVRISGVVTDENGEPLIGVSVMEKGTNNGAITDINGHYSFTASSKDAVVDYSYIGYATQSTRPGERQHINVSMEEEGHALNEVVVTALGIKREKKMLGYSVQDVKADQITKTGDNQVASALQGKVAGLSINSSTTGLGGSAKITIRGNSSLADNNQPLWIVDGVPFTEESYSNASMYGGIDRGSTSLDINPEDIESISVLKGPNAAALYGSRAGNGVILITTKKGTRKEGFGVSYNGTFTWTKVADELERQTLYGQGSKGEYLETGTYSFGPQLDGSMKTAWNGLQVPYSNYNEHIMRNYFNTGFNQTHNVAIGNVKEDMHYRASMGYSNADGMFEGEELRKINIDVNAGYKINKILSIDSKISLSQLNAKNRPTYGIYGEVSQLMLVPNNVRLSDLKNYSTAEKYHVNWTGPTIEYLNPYYVNKQRKNEDTRWRAFGYYSMKANITPWLYLQGKFAFDYYRTKIFVTDLSDGTKYNTLQEIKEDNMTRQEENHFESNSEFILAGDNTVAEKFRINYMAGTNFMYSTLNTYGGLVKNMVYKKQWYWNHAQNIDNVTENGWKRRTNSVFASLSLAYNEYVSLDITARNDWSSTLPSKNRSYFYPSFNLGFVASDFMRHHFTLPSWMTFAKVRLSAAKVGKDADPYSTYNRVEGGYLMGAYKPTISYIKANADLKPEVAWSYEAGLDMKFLDNRLGFDFTYYNTRTSNQIMQIPEPAPWQARIINSGLVVNEGIELMLYATPVRTRDFAFDLNVNMAHNRTTVKELNRDVKYIYFNGDGFMPVYVGAIEGGKLGDIFAKRMYKRDNAGNIIVRENGEPVIISDQEYSRSHPIGNIQPDLLLSVTPSFTYKGISLSALFDMKFGGDIVSVSEAVATSHGIAKRTEKRGQFVLPGVSENGQPNAASIEAEDFYRLVGGRDNAVAEEFVHDASFIRLKELSLGYSFPRTMLKKTPLTGLRLSFVARNLVYLMKHTPGTSPEGGYDTSMFSQAIDFSSLPYSRTFGLSVNIAF